eukprot:COSAG05_NODE_631_length_8203_cov_23.575148_3_plen_69_part_00
MSIFNVATTTTQASTHGDVRTRGGWIGGCTGEGEDDGTVHSPRTARTTSASRAPGTSSTVTVDTYDAT